jgi:hypothetical protein
MCQSLILRFLLMQVTNDQLRQYRLLWKCANFVLLNEELCKHLSSPHACHLSRHLIRPDDHPYNIWRRAQIVKFLLMQFVFSFLLLPLNSEYLPLISVLEHLQPMLFP